MLIITCLLRLLNLFKIDLWKYLLFVTSYLYMWICVYLSAGFGYLFGFRVSVRVSGIRGFSFGDGFSSESVFGLDSGFDFGFWLRVLVLGIQRLHSIRTQPVAILNRDISSLSLARGGRLLSTLEPAHYCYYGPVVLARRLQALKVAFTVVVACRWCLCTGCCHALAQSLRVGSCPVLSPSLSSLVCVPQV
jgi:hypothetical protein